MLEVIFKCNGIRCHLFTFN